MKMKIDLEVLQPNWLREMTLDDKTLKKIKESLSPKKDVSKELDEILELEALIKQTTSSNPQDRWTGGYVPPEKRHYHSEGTHIGPNKGRFSIIGVEVDQHGDSLQPQQESPSTPTEPTEQEISNVREILSSNDSDRDPYPEEVADTPVWFEQLTDEWDGWETMSDAVGSTEWLSENRAQLHSDMQRIITGGRDVVKANGGASGPLSDVDSELSDDYFSPDNIETVEAVGIDVVAKQGDTFHGGRVFKVTTKDGKSWAYKIAAEDWKGEELFFTLDRALGMNIAPAVHTSNLGFGVLRSYMKTRKKMDEKPPAGTTHKSANQIGRAIVEHSSRGGGHFQEWVEGEALTLSKKRFPVGDVADTRPFIAPNRRKAFIKMALLDKITGNFDRHTGNFQYDEDKGLVPIDSGAAGMSYEDSDISQSGKTPYGLRGNLGYRIGWKKADGSIYETFDSRVYTKMDVSGLVSLIESGGLPEEDFLAEVDEVFDEFYKPEIIEAVAKATDTPIAGGNKALHDVAKNKLAFRTAMRLTTVLAVERRAAYLARRQKEIDDARWGF
tara:strand:+ start:2114 stop:3778 length:1665 start_codon:yes stop_codon:yes gene_type:complete